MAPLAVTVTAGGMAIYYLQQLTDTYRHEDCAEFTMVAVLPLLESGEPVTLATDSLGLDWHWIQEIFQIDGPCPENLARNPLLLTINYLNDYDRSIEAVERRHHAFDDAKANRLVWTAADRIVTLIRMRGWQDEIRALLRSAP